jgi:hypothetical protein
MNTPIPETIQDTDPTSIKLDVNSWNIKIRDRRNNRMRLQINLTKDEGLAFKNFSSICKPDEVTDSDFLKTVFVTGIEALNTQLSEMVRQYALEHKEELASSGITVTEGSEGEVSLGQTPSEEETSTEE